TDEMTGRVIKPRKRLESEGSTRSPYGEDLRRSSSDGRDAATDKSGEVRASLPGSESTARHHTPSARKPGDLDGASLPMVGGRQEREGDKPQSASVAIEESDACMVPEKSANSRVTPEEPAEGKRAA